VRGTASRCQAAPLVRARGLGSLLGSLPLLQSRCPAARALQHLARRPSVAPGPTQGCAARYDRWTERRPQQVVDLAEGARGMGQGPQGSRTQHRHRENTSCMLLLETVIIGYKPHTHERKGI
jgi:hypothetical protein